MSEMTTTDTDWLVGGETWLGDKKTGTVRMAEPPYVGMQIPMAEGGYFEITALHFEPEASLTETDRAAIAWELTGMLGIDVRPEGDGWALDEDQTRAWWNRLEPRARAAMVAGYRLSVQEMPPG